MKRQAKEQRVNKNIGMKQSVIMVTFLLVCVAVTSFGQNISEDAKRHFDRAMAAVEMAKSPEDYKSAIKEFEQAVQLAPDWADVYYNLGMVQEKAEKYGDAATSLKHYVLLAPDASDADAVRTLINKLEYKAEQMLTPKDYADILVSLHDNGVWEVEGKEQSCKACNLFLLGGFVRVGENLVKVCTAVRPNPGDSSNPFKTYEEIKTDGNKINYSWLFYECVPGAGESCRIEENYEIEIVSCNQVKVKGTRSHWRASGVPVSFSYEYRRK
jgi:tetratricopeptide (TPR) repeat protein